MADEKKKEGRKPEDLVRWPGVALLFVGIADLIVSIFTLLSGDAVFSAAVEALRKENPELAEQLLKQWADPTNLVMTGVGLLISILVALGGWSLMSHKSWGLALMGAILTMIPCFGPCCGVFFPFGLWAVVVLMRADVREVM